METEDNLIFIQVKGQSMWPFLLDGDKLIIKKAVASELRVGDVILYASNNDLICHRLVRIMGKNGKYLLYARGDNSTSASEQISETKILGKAIGIINGDRMVFMKSWYYAVLNKLIVFIYPIVSKIIKSIEPYLSQSIKILLKRILCKLR